MLYRVSTSGPSISDAWATAPSGTIVPLRVADPQAVDVVFLVAEPRFRLGDHLPGSAEEIEIVDVKRAEIDLQAS